MGAVMVPIDGSELSERAVHLGQSLARALSLPLELVHVIEEPIALDFVPAVEVASQPQAEMYLKSVTERFAGDVPVKTRILRGNPTEELLRLSATTPGSFIVMSTHGRGGLGRVVFGSVADKVMRGSMIPVVLARDTAKEPAQGIRNLLVPLDGSEIAERVLPLAREMARRSGAALHLVRVVESLLTAPAYAAYAAQMAYVSDDQVVQIEREMQADARAYMDETAGKLRHDDVRVFWEVRLGRPADEISRAAETTSADLILMSSHGRSGVRRWAYGSVANEIVHRGVAPVLVLPSHAPEIESLNGVNEPAAMKSEAVTK